MPDTAAALPPNQAASAPSTRQVELLESSYRYVLEHGLADMSLRPLAEAVGSSPRVLLYLFGSKDNFVRALLARARQDELGLLEQLPDSVNGTTLAVVARQIWAWLATTEHRPLLTLWFEAYSRSLNDQDGPWAGFAEQTVRDWLQLLAGFKPTQLRQAPTAPIERTYVLALLRGCLADLLATGDTERTTAAFDQALAALSR